MKTRKSMYALVAVALTAGIYSCQPAVPAAESLTGYVADATMNNIMIITNSGDTLNISTMDADPAKVPGVMINDSVEIFYSKEKIGENEILKADSLTVTVHSPYFYIAGTWLEPNPINAAETQGVTLEQGGTASSVGMATLLFEKWEFNGSELTLTSKSIGNKQTIEVIDTLVVEKLDADSLILSKAGDVVWRFAREK